MIINTSIEKNSYTKDEVNVLLASKAPSGYGLGDFAPYIDDCNKAVLSGWYKWDINCANSPFDYATMISSGRYDGLMNQIAICNAGPDQGKMAYRAFCDGVGEWQIINNSKDSGAWATYLALLNNASTDMVSAALGRNNEDADNSVGKALVMYMKYQDSSINLETSFPNLSKCQKLKDMNNNIDCAIEIANNLTLWNYLYNNTYAKSMLFIDYLSGSCSSPYDNVGEGTWSGNLIITDDMINGSKTGALYLSANSNNYSHQTMRINGVTLVEGYKVGISQRLILTPNLLKQYNITQAGTYPIYLKSYTSYSKYPASSSITLILLK